MDAITSSKLKTWYYVFRTDHHMFYQGLVGAPTVCGAEAYATLRSCARDSSVGEFCVVGRFLLHVNHDLPTLAALIVRSTTYAPTLMDQDQHGPGGKWPAPLSRTAEQEAAEDAVCRAFDAAIRDCQLWLQLAWIPEWDAKETEDIDEEDDKCPCRGLSSMHVGTVKPR